MDSPLMLVNAASSENAALAVRNLEVVALQMELTAAKLLAEFATTRADYWESLVSDQAQIIRDTRKELIEKNDLLGRAGIGVDEPKSPNPFRSFETDRRRLGA